MRIDTPNSIVLQKAAAVILMSILLVSDGLCGQQEPAPGPSNAFVMGHMLASSTDLIDMIHTHPFVVLDPIDAKYKQIHFNVIFSRLGVYRVWAQFQRQGVVNKNDFNIPVNEVR